MAIRRKQVQSIVVLYGKGNYVGDSETDEMEKAITDEAAAGNRRLVLNLSECEWFNSTAIGMLVGRLTHYRARDGEIKLCGLGKRMKNLFVMMKLIEVFDHYDSEEEALASFAAA